MRNYPRRWRDTILIGILSAASVFGAASGVRASGTPPPLVSEVRVELVSELPQPVGARILEALSAVVTKALKGQEVAKVERLRPAVEQVVGEVFRRVLTGYRTTGVTVVPGETTYVRLAVTATGPVIREVVTRLEVEGIDQGLRPILADGLVEVDRAAEGFLGGVPVEALSWARFALQPLLERELEGRLPGFAVKVGIEPGETTILTARLTSQGDRVRRVRVRMSSETIPAVVLRQLSAEVEGRAALMVGLPVAFLQAYRADLEREIDRRVREAPSLRRWGLTTRTRLRTDVDTVLDLGLESANWRLRLEGVLNIGEKAPGPELRLLSGWRVGPAELLLGSRTQLTGLDEQLQAGVGIPAGWGGEVSYLWGGGGTRVLRFQKRISAYQRYGLERILPGDDWRASFGVAADEYLMVELVGGPEAVWLSLVANL
ncbi:MAG: hypothetical protein ACM3UP_01115 [Methanocella sp.]